MKKLIVATAAALSLAVFAPLAQASKFEVFVDGGGPDYFTGHVEGKKSCLEKRRVTV